MNNLPKVLIACPVHEVKSYCIDLWISHVKAFTYPNFDIFLADNSPTENFSKYLKSQGINVVWNNPAGKDVYRAMETSHEACRKEAINKKYDFLFHLECDIFPPSAWIIQDLMQHNKPVVSGLYHIQHGPKSNLLAQSVLIDDTLGFETFNLDPDSADLFVDGRVKRVFSSGIGCTLIKREVFEKIPFRTQAGINLHPDTYFCLDLRKNKIMNYCDTNIICRHENSDWNTILKETEKV